MLGQCRAARIDFFGALRTALRHGQRTCPRVGLVQPGRVTNCGHSGRAIARVRTAPRERASGAANNGTLGHSGGHQVTAVYSRRGEGASRQGHGATGERDRCYLLRASIV